MISDLYSRFLNLFFIVVIAKNRVFGYDSYTKHLFAILCIGGPEKFIDNPQEDSHLENHFFRRFRRKSMLNSLQLWKRFLFFILVLQMFEPLIFFRK